MPNVGPVANDNGGSPVGVGVQATVPAREHRLALAVIFVPVSAAWAGLRRALRWNGYGIDAEFGGFLSQEFASMSDGGLGETLVELAFGLHVLARHCGGASGGSHHADRMQAFYRHHFGLGF